MYPLLNCRCLCLCQEFVAFSPKWSSGNAETSQDASDLHLSSRGLLSLELCIFPHHRRDRHNGNTQVKPQKCAPERHTCADVPANAIVILSWSHYFQDNSIQFMDTCSLRSSPCTALLVFWWSSEVYEVCDLQWSKLPLATFLYLMDYVANPLFFNRNNDKCSKIVSMSADEWSW